jgi:hypothetical protein
MLKLLRFMKLDLPDVKENVLFGVWLALSS